MQQAGSPSRDSAAPDAGAAGVARPPERSSAVWLRLGLLSLVALATVAGIAAFSYQLALARVPQHRATLERLVRARTGLDLRFNELGVRWGWYGPEAVFRRVELGEPGQSAVLLRASELIVGFDAWRSAQTGQLEAGRITFVAPDIDFTRAQSGGPLPGAATLPRSQASTPSSTQGHAVAARANATLDLLTDFGRAQLLKRWPRGRVDIESGTVRVPAPGNSNDSIALQIQHASLRRSDEVWSASAQFFLPERLGRTARISFRLEGDPDVESSLSGNVRFEGQRVAFSGWRDLLDNRWSSANLIPSTGGGDLSIALIMRKGRIASGRGEVRAGDVSYRRGVSPAEYHAYVLAALPDNAEHGSELPTPLSARRSLEIGYLRGDWQIARRANGWRLNVAGLRFGEQGRDGARTTLTVNWGSATRSSSGVPMAPWAASSSAAHASVSTKLGRAPVAFLASAAQWFVPDLDLGAAVLDGEASDIEFEWSAASEPGHRLRISADVNELSLASRSGSVALTGLKARLDGDEANLVADIKSTDAKLTLAGAQEQVLDELNLTTRLQLRREEGDWELATEQLNAEHDHGKLQLSGALHMPGARMRDSALAMTTAERPVGGSGATNAVPEPVLEVRGTLERFDVPVLTALFGEQAQRLFGAVSSRLTGGRVEQAEFEFAGALAEDPLVRARTFSGSLTLRDGVLAAQNSWPEARGFDAQLDWNGRQAHARVDRGSSGPFELTSMTADWRLDGSQPVRIAAQGRGRLESVLEWLRATPEAAAYAPHAENLAARGSALFNFTASLPSDKDAARKRPPRIRVAASLDGALIQLMPQFPAVESVSGTLAFDSGRLQRSTLSASWLGGPATLRLAERRERGVITGLVVQAQGTLDSEQLLAATQLAPATRLSGRTPWKGEFAYTPASQTQSPSWRARVDSSLLGVTSELPAPFEKDAETARALRVNVDGNELQALVRVELGEELRSAFEMHATPKGEWQLGRGAVRFGGAAAELPEQRGMQLRGHINRLDLPAWFAASRELVAEETPIDADLTVNELLVGGRSYSTAALNAQTLDSGLQLTINSAGLAGNVHWPHDASDGDPVEVRFARLDIPPNSGEGTLGALRAVLGATSDISVEELSWQGRPLGRLSAQARATDAGLVVPSIRLDSPSHEVRASLTCRFVSAPCRMEFELESRDAAATLRELGFRDELTASNATLRGELVWPFVSQRPWLESVSGNLHLALNDGMTRSPAEIDGRSFPLFAVPALLRQSAAQSTQTAQSMQAIVPTASTSAGATPQLKFADLEADFELNDGVATTSNLHFDGDAEIIMRGRIRFAPRDYDYTAWVLRGEERLPAAMRRLGASPRVAAAWMALRDFISGPETDNSRAIVHLGGTWEAPSVGPVEADPPEDSSEER